MHLKKHRLVVLMSLIGLTLSACTPGGERTVVPTLPPETQTNVEQNLNNNQIPAPRDVQNNTVPPAPNACQELQDALPSSWFRGKIEVPENPAEPAGRKINVFYYGRIHPNSVPTIFYNGGPGGDSHGSYYTLMRSQNILDPQRKISFIFIDQRGNGCSDPYPQMPRNATAEQKEEILQRLKFYGSSGIVADSELLRQKLISENKISGDKWNIFGQSYGAFIVHRYVINSAAAVKEALSHANTIQSSPESRLQERIASQVRVMQNYLQRYPDDRQKLEKLKELLPNDRCFENADKSQEICGHGVLEIFNSLLGFTNSWHRMNEWINLLVENNTINQRQMGLFLAAFYFSEFDPQNMKGWMHRVLSWVDRNVASTSIYNCHRVKKALQEQNIDLQNALVHECMESLQYPEPQQDARDPHAEVRHLPRDLMSIERLQTSLQENPQLRFNWYSGQLDTFVPVGNFAEQLNVIRSLPNVHYTNFPNSGHEGFAIEPQLWQDLQRASAVAE